LTLKNTYLEPRYVLLLPETREGHERRLLEKGVYTAEQVQLTLDRAEFYAQFNGEHPGYFDTTLSSGSLLFVVQYMVKKFFKSFRFAFCLFLPCIFPYLLTLFSVHL